MLSVSTGESRVGKHSERIDLMACPAGMQQDPQSCARRGTSRGLRFQHGVGKGISATHVIADSWVSPAARCIASGAASCTETMAAGEARQMPNSGLLDDQQRLVGM